MQKLLTWTLILNCSSDSHELKMSRCVPATTPATDWIVQSLNLQPVQPVQGLPQSPQWLSRSSFLLRRTFPAQELRRTSLGELTHLIQAPLLPVRLSFVPESVRRLLVARRAEAPPGKPGRASRSLSPADFPRKTVRSSRHRNVTAFPIVVHIE